jgi:hypothetical protein
MSKKGMIEIKAKKTEAGSVMRVRTLSRYCAVFLPGLIPGMKPPDRFRLSAISTGLKTMAV